MPKPLTLGQARSGYAEVIRNASGADPIGVKVKVNTANASGIEDFDEGEWVVINSTGDAAKASASAEALAFPTITGKERPDVIGSRTTTILVGNGFHMRTSGYDAAGTYTFGTKLAAKSGKLTPAASGEDVLAIVI